MALYDGYLALQLLAASGQLLTVFVSDYPSNHVVPWNLHQYRPPRAFNVALQGNRHCPYNL